MADNSNDWHFKRGLNPGFMEKLKSLAEQGDWFSDVLADRDLILGIRDNYVNVYWRGQSLFKIGGKNGPLRFTTHPKYLIDPRLSKAVSFDGRAFEVGGHKALTTKYDGETLGRMKQAARLYAGDEKKGVHAVVRANPNVIDMEVAFNSAADEENEPHTPRIDLACFEELDGKIRLCFWEAKLYRNGELFADGDTQAPVVEQIKTYRDLIEKHRQEIVDSYRLVARNLAEIARWAPPRKIDPLVEQVASDRAVPIDAGPFVGLIVYGFDADQRDGLRWKTHKAKLTHIPVVAAGEAKNIKLHWTHSG
jgi:hypothetical protein